MIVSQSRVFWESGDRGRRAGWDGEGRYEGMRRCRRGLGVGGEEEVCEGMRRCRR